MGVLAAALSCWKPGSKSVQVVQDAVKHSGVILSFD
jgi:hypothetical protein